MHHSSFASLLQLHFIDVGQGDSIFIETPKGKKVLIDAGSHSKGSDPSNPFHYLKEKFKPDKPFEIDLAIITHPHDDHYGGLKYLCQKRRVPARIPPAQDLFQRRQAFISIHDQEMVGPLAASQENRPAGEGLGEIDLRLSILPGDVVHVGAALADQVPGGSFGFG